MDIVAVIEGGIPFLGGLLLLWLGSRRSVRERTPTNPIVRHARWIGPLLMLFGVFLAVKSHHDNKALAGEIAAQQIAARVELPLKVDEITTWTAIEGRGKELRMSYAVSETLGQFGGRERAERLLLQQACAHPKMPTVGSLYELHFVYTFAGPSEQIELAPNPTTCGKSGL